MAAVGLQGEDEGCYWGRSWGKRMSMCITSILPDRDSNRWLLMEFYINGRFVQFLVCVPAISAQTRRYHRLITGTISSFGSTCLSAPWH